MNIALKVPVTRPDLQRSFSSQSGIAYDMVATLPSMLNKSTAQESKMVPSSIFTDV